MTKKKRVYVKNDPNVLVICEHADDECIGCIHHSQHYSEPGLFDRGCMTESMECFKPRGKHRCVPVYVLPFLKK